MAPELAVERATGQAIPWVFHRDGRPIKHFRRAWLTACKEAKAPHRIPHDFRRTAVRNLERARVPRSAAMKMVGRKTEAIYRRYAIADESMLREGAAKLEAFLQAQRGAADGGAAENRQSNGKVGGWRHAARGRERRGTH